MKRVLKITLPAALAIVLIAVVVHTTGIGQTITPCPALRTDPFGFPLDPPYSEYITGGSSDTFIGPIEVLKANLPCCVDPDGNIVPADGTLELCIFPNQQIGQCPDICCPALVEVNLTEDVQGAVKNCIPEPGDSPNSGGSNYTELIGENAG